MKMNNKRPWIVKVPKTARKLNSIYGNYRIVSQGKVLWQDGTGMIESIEPFVIEYETKSGKPRRIEAKSR